MEPRPFLQDRLGWHKYVMPFMEKRLPGDMGWSSTLGGCLAIMFLVQAITGMVLALYYSPSPEHAYGSVAYLTKEAFAGRLLRGIHHWGASAMVVLCLAHMAASFFYGAYKPPRELTWLFGVCLLLLTLAFGFTGYLLPWDQKAYWATVVGTNLPSAIPLVGKMITMWLRGGQEVSGLTLTRFYALHIAILPALTVLAASVHIYLVRIHEPSGHWDPAHPGKKSSIPFFPDHVSRTLLSFAIVFSAVLVMSTLVDLKMERPALSPEASYSPRPEWYFMWLFQLLSYLSGPAELLGTFVIPLGVFLALAALPFLSTSPARSPAERPIATALFVAGLAGFFYLTAVGVSESHIRYGQVVVLPDRALTPSELRGVRLWVEMDCAYCHNVLGKGGRRRGPDLSNTARKGRSRSWIIRAIKDPRSISSRSIMPKYELSEQELSDLADYILSLDFERIRPRLATRAAVLKGDLGP